MVTIKVSKEYQSQKKGKYNKENGEIKTQQDQDGKNWFED